MAQTYKSRCIALMKKHDAVAKDEFDRLSCGYCDTEDCSCDGFSEECECTPCELVYNLLENTGYVKLSWEAVWRLYL